VAGTAPPPPVPAYRDYIAWLQRQDLRQAQEFWTTALAGIQPSRLALRAAGTENGTGAVERRTVRLPESLTGGLREAAARHRVTFSTLVQATWAIVLHGYTGLPEITFGCATSGRPAELPQVDRMVGLFANTLPLRVTVPGDGDTGPWLRQIQNSHAAMRRYEYSPLADIKKWAGHPGQQLFDSLLVLENYSLAIEADTGQDAETGPVRFSVQALYDKIDLPLTLTIAPDPVSELQLLIHRDRFQPGFTDDILKRLHQTLETIGTTDRIAPVLAAVGSPPVHAVPPPEPGPSRPATPTPPSTPEEHAIAAVYEEILGISGIDVTASFFELGGDSFAAVRAVGRIDGATVSLLAAHPTVRDLARAIAPADPQTDLDAEIADLEQRLAAKQAARQAAEKQPAKPGRVVPVPREGTLPCTYQQEGLWFLSRLDPTSTTYHIPFTLRLRGALDVPALERAVHALVIRHEALRTRFVEHQGRPRQVIEPPPATFSLPVAELTIDEVGRWSATEISRPFDLEAGALFRVNLARLASGEHALVMVVHHIVADGWSSKMLATDLSLLYAAETGVTGVELPALTVQAADYAAWQRGWLDGAELERQMAYWREKLAGLPTVDFPADRIRPSQPTGAGATAARRFADDLAAAARGYTRAEQVSFLAVLQAALLTVLHRYTGQQDLVIGSIFTGRTRPEIEPVVGFFANTLVLRTDIGGEPSFAELVHRSHDTVLNATEHQEVPFGLIVDALQPERVAGRNPLFQISLSLQPADIRAGLALGAVAAEPIDLTGGYSRFDIAIDVIEGTNRLDLVTEYSTELFDTDRIERLLDHLTAALANGLAAPGSVADDIDIMTTAERDQVLQAWNPLSGPRFP
jgi:non-ribosomal peptide synthetase component F